MEKFDEYTVDSNPDLLNPERGFYTNQMPEPDDYDDHLLLGLGDPTIVPHTIVPAWLWLAPWCDKDLVWDPTNGTTSEVLKDYANHLEECRVAGVKVLFRPRYDDGPEKDGQARNDCKYLINGVPNGPPVFHAVSLEQQKNHINAVAAMLGDYKDVIAFIQAGYLGNYGEWNDADYDNDQTNVHIDYDNENVPLLYTRPYRSDIIDHVLFAYDAEGIAQDVELRRPVFAKEVVERWEAPANSAIYQGASPNVGLHNDCFMSSENNNNEEWPKISGHDSGTYSHFKDFLTFSDLTASSNLQNLSTEPEIDLETVEKARKCAEELTENSSFGGETCGATDSERWRTCSNMTEPSSEPESLHMNYLNADWHKDAVTVWSTSVPSCYDAIRRNLGYRFEVTSVEYPETVSAGDTFSVAVDVVNTGWARLHKPRIAKLVLRNVAPPDPDKVVHELDGGEVEKWEPGWELGDEPNKLSITDQEAPSTPGMYSVRLWIPDPDLQDNDPDIPAGHPKAKINYAVKLASKRTDDNGDIVNVFDQTTGENDLGVKIEVQ